MATPLTKWTDICGTKSSQILPLLTPLCEDSVSVALAYPFLSATDKAAVLGVDRTNLVLLLSYLRTSQEVIEKTLQTIRE